MENNICNNGNIHLIGVQKEFRDKTLEAVKKGLDLASGILKYTDYVDVAVFDSEAWDIHPKLNLSAHARVYYIDIKICFYKKDIDLGHLFNVDIPATVYHELSHVVRANSVGYPENLLQDLIDEGIACYIEESSGLNPKQPYILPITDEQKYIDEAKDHFGDRLTSNIHNEWFYGSGKMPDWIGYRVGYLMVKRFMEDKRLELDKLVRTKAEDFIL